MKFEHILRVVARGVRSELEQCNNYDALLLIVRDMMISGFEGLRGVSAWNHGSIEPYIKKVEEEILACDVRKVGWLRRLFPNHFPAKLRHGELVCYVANNPNSDWMVELKQKT